MSSLTRRLQIRALKRRGWRRLPFIIGPDGVGGLRKQPVTKAGLIANTVGQIIGRHWPQSKAEFAAIGALEAGV